MNSDNALQEILECAVNSCFVGTAFLFGVKLTGAPPIGEQENQSKGRLASVISRLPTHDGEQPVIVAYQILPADPKNKPCTVKECFQNLLRERRRDPFPAQVPPMTPRNTSLPTSFCDSVNFSGGSCLSYAQTSIRMSCETGHTSAMNSSERSIADLTSEWNSFSDNHQGAAPSNSTPHQLINSSAGSSNIIKCNSQVQQEVDGQVHLKCSDADKKLCRVEDFPSDASGTGHLAEVEEVDPDETCFIPPDESPERSRSQSPERTRSYGQMAIDKKQQEVSASLDETCDISGLGENLPNIAGSQSSCVHDADGIPLSDTSRICDDDEKEGNEDFDSDDESYLLLACQEQVFNQVVAHQEVEEKSPEHRIQVEGQADPTQITAPSIGQDGNKAVEHVLPPARNTLNYKEQGSDSACQKCPDQKGEFGERSLHAWDDAINNPFDKKDMERCEVDNKVSNHNAAYVVNKSCENDDIIQNVDAEVEKTCTENLDTTKENETVMEGFMETNNTSIGNPCISQLPAALGVKARTHDGDSKNPDEVEEEDRTIDMSDNDSLLLLAGNMLEKHEHVMQQGCCDQSNLTNESHYYHSVSMPTGNQGRGICVNTNTALQNKPVRSDASSCVTSTTTSTLGTSNLDITQHALPDSIRGTASVSGAFEAEEMMPFSEDLDAFLEDLSDESQLSEKHETNCAKDHIDNANEPVKNCSIIGRKEALKIITSSAKDLGNDENAHSATDGDDSLNAEIRSPPAKTARLDQIGDLFNKGSETEESHIHLPNSEDLQAFLADIEEGDMSASAWTCATPEPQHPENTSDSQKKRAESKSEVENINTLRTEFNVSVVTESDGSEGPTCPDSGDDVSTCLESQDVCSKSTECIPMGSEKGNSPLTAGTSTCKRPVSSEVIRADSGIVTTSGDGKDGEAAGIGGGSGIDTSVQVHNPLCVSGDSSQDLGSQDLFGASCISENDRDPKGGNLTDSSCAYAHSGHTCDGDDEEEDDDEIIQDTQEEQDVKTRGGRSQFTDRATSLQTAKQRGSYDSVNYSTPLHKKNVQFALQLSVTKTLAAIDKKMLVTESPLSQVITPGKPCLKKGSACRIWPAPSISDGKNSTLQKVLNSSSGSDSALSCELNDSDDDVFVDEDQGQRSQDLFSPSPGIVSQSTRPLLGKRVFQSTPKLTLNPSSVSDYGGDKASPKGTHQGETLVKGSDSTKSHGKRTYRLRPVCYGNSPLLKACVKNQQKKNRVNPEFTQTRSYDSTCLETPEGELLSVLPSGEKKCNKNKSPKEENKESSSKNAFSVRPKTFEEVESKAKECEGYCVVTPIHSEDELFPSSTDKYENRSISRVVKNLDTSEDKENQVVEYGSDVDLFSRSCSDVSGLRRHSFDSTGYSNASSEFIPATSDCHRMKFRRFTRKPVRLSLPSASQESMKAGYSASPDLFGSDIDGSTCQDKQSGKEICKKLF